ncbi:hypothetical protein M9458_025466, partial [Cirrhinus mrigala]
QSRITDTLFQRSLISTLRCLMRTIRRRISRWPLIMDSSRSLLRWAQLSRAMPISPPPSPLSPWITTSR